MRSCEDVNAARSMHESYSWAVIARISGLGTIAAYARRQKGLEKPKSTKVKAPEGARHQALLRVIDGVNCELAETARVVDMVFLYSPNACFSATVKFFLK